MCLRASSSCGYGACPPRDEPPSPAQGTLISNIFQRVTTVTSWWVNTDPLAQTFTPEKNCQIGGVDLWFTACGSNVRVQLRETQNGFPSRVVAADATIPMATMLTNGQPTRIAFPFPASLIAGEEYALVVLCDDAQTALAVAELGRFDSNVQRLVTQPAIHSWNAVILQQREYMDGPSGQGYGVSPAGGEFQQHFACD